jgi:hypothetical protein
VKVRVFHGMNKVAEDPIPQGLPLSHRIRPKAESWEEVLARFEKGVPPKPADTDEPEETSTPDPPQN